MGQRFCGPSFAVASDFRRSKTAQWFFRIEACLVPKTQSGLTVQDSV